MTLPELLISMTILAMMMAALAAAVHAGLTSQDMSVTLSDLTQAGRSIMQRMTREIRAASDVECATGQLTITPSSGGHSIVYELTDGTFYYKTRESESADPVSSVMLASDDDITVSAFTITLTEVVPDEGSDYTTMATVVLTLSGGGQSYTVTGSAAPRKFLD
jgi:type II secretory pathway pseudopilin PulG